MGLIRLLIFAVLVYLVWRTVSSLRRNLGAPEDDPSPTEGDAETMYPCQQCGVYVPEHLAIRHQGHYFCSQAHQQDFLENHER